MTTTHTPGPWGLMEHQDGFLTLTPPDGRCAYFGMLPNEDDEDRANGRLIAAAPDLLAALELLGANILALPTPLFEQISEHIKPGVAASRAAISRAKGEA